jgi:hypothetical protein
MRCIEARLRLEREKEQQETLILSVIPAHIGKEKKNKNFCFFIGYFLFIYSFKYEIRNVT